MTINDVRDGMQREGGGGGFRGGEGEEKMIRREEGRESGREREKEGVRGEDRVSLGWVWGEGNGREEEREREREGEGGELPGGDDGGGRAVRVVIARDVGLRRTRKWYVTRTAWWLRYGKMNLSIHNSLILSSAG